MTTIEKMAHAIMRFEGYYEGSRSYRNNNPGNLKAAKQIGLINTDDEGHAVFADFRVGWNALVHQLNQACSGASKIYKPWQTLTQFFAIYAEESKYYAQFVATMLGVSTETTLKELKDFKN